MARDKQSAPQAFDAGVAEEQNPTSRPTEVLLAVRLLWVMYGIGVVVVLANQLLAKPQQPVVQFIVTQLVGLFFAFLIYRNLFDGRNWARILYLVAVVLYSALYLSPQMRAAVANAPLLSRISLTLKFPLLIYILWLLFTSPGKSWFQKGS
jgi:hypothetical protein